jgi:hypothetical protein
MQERLSPRRISQNAMNSRLKPLPHPDQKANTGVTLASVSLWLNVYWFNPLSGEDTRL